MKINFFIKLTVISFAIFTFSLRSYGKATIAVLPFQVGNLKTIQIGKINITPKILETEFSNQLISFLVKSRKFDVLDRESIQKILDENQLTESEWAKPGQRQKIGKLLVADYLVTGHIDRISLSAKKVNIKITGENRVDITATFKLSLHITQVSSGKIVFADTITEKVKSTDVRRELPVEEWKDWTLFDYRDLLFKRTVEKAGNAILQGIYPVKVASVSGNIVILNRGKGAGIKENQIYTVFNTQGVIKDPDTGEILGTNEIETATIKVISVQPKFTKAKIIKKSGTIKIGAICRCVKENEPSVPEPQYPKADQPTW